MKCSHANKSATLLAGILCAAAPIASHVRADETERRRLPPVTSGPSAENATAAQNVGSVQHLLESFKKQKAIVKASQRKPAAETPAPADRKKQEQRWLRSSTSSASFEVARRMIEQSSREYSVGAWASAETSAWEALRRAAEGVEIAARESGQDAGSGQRRLQGSALANLQIARTAIREARDFGGQYGAVDPSAIRRMVMSHETTLLDAQPIHSLSAADAIDRYLDEARVRLSGIASTSVEAAQAMDLLAAIYLGRANARTLPSSTALCLRRAAIQGQPTNPSLALRLGMHLADLGLYDEARWALQHSMNLQPTQEASDALITVLRKSGRGEEASRLIAANQSRTLQSRRQTPRVPEVEQVTPQDFATISKPVTPRRKTNFVTGKLASARMNLLGRSSKTPSDDGVADVEVEVPASEEPKQPSRIRRFFGSLFGSW